MKKIHHKDLISIQKIGARIEAGVELSEIKKLNDEDVLAVVAQIGKVCDFLEKAIECKKTKKD